MTVCVRRGVARPDLTWLPLLDDKWRGKKLSKQAVEQLSPLERFEYTHRNVRGRWEVSGGFPSRAVVEVESFGRSCSCVLV